MSENSSDLLEVSGVDVHFGARASRKQVIQGASFSIGRGEVVGMIGETGSGKSTLARTILGLVKPTAGRIAFDGQDLTAFSSQQWRSFRRSGAIQYVFQDPLRSLDPDFTLEQSISEPLLVSGSASRTDVPAIVRDYISRVLLDENLLGKVPGEISGGQRQRAAIARALITEPKLVILDEPVSALDSANRVQILDLLQGLAGPGVSLLFISHDLGSIAGITDRTAVVYRGEIVEVDDTETIVNAPSHPYTRLLVGSAPTLASGATDRAWREDLRARLGTG